MKEPIRSRGVVDPDVSHEFVTHLLAYCPETGVLRWRNHWFRQYCGRIAGSIDGNGYVRLNINRKSVAAHRLAWFITYGSWPSGILDHINRVRSDNRIANLREATFAQNAWNREATSGTKGVHFEKRERKWRAAISIKGRSKHIGYYASEEEAALAYRSAALRVHGEFARALLPPKEPSE